MPKDTFLNLNDDKQERVIRAAVQEFNKHGYEKANVSEIAKNAEVAKGSIYQYFENKRELFLYSITWTIDMIMKKYKYLTVPENLNIFDYFYDSSHKMLDQISEERELAIFVQDVVIGKYSSLKDETLSIINKTADEYLFKLIGDGKKNGSIRKDINDRMLFLFFYGASLKIKEDILNNIKESGKNFLDVDAKDFDNNLKDMMELLKNGMGERNVFNN